MEIGVCGRGWISIAGSEPEERVGALQAGPTWYTLIGDPAEGAASLNQVYPSAAGVARRLLEGAPEPIAVQCLAASLQLLSSQMSATYGTVGCIATATEELAHAIQLPQLKWNKRGEVTLESVPETFSRQSWFDMDHVGVLGLMLECPIPAGRWSDHPSDNRELEAAYGSAIAGAIARVQIKVVADGLPIRLHEGAKMWLPLGLARALQSLGCDLEVTMVRTPAETRSLERYVQIPPTVKGVGRYSISGQLAAGMVAWFLCAHAEIPEGVRWTLHALVIEQQLRRMLPDATDSTDVETWTWQAIKALPGSIRAELLMHLGMMATCEETSSDSAEATIRRALRC
mgnify:CR=1 FL=1